jgi:hypothetical protein
MIRTRMSTLKNVDDLADIIPMENMPRGDVTGRQHLMRLCPQAQASPGASGPSLRASAGGAVEDEVREHHCSTTTQGERTLPSMWPAGGPARPDPARSHEAPAPGHYASRVARFRPPTRSRRALCLASWLYRFFGGGGTFARAPLARQLDWECLRLFFAFSHVEIRA